MVNTLVDKEPKHTEHSQSHQHTFLRLTTDKTNASLNLNIGITEGH